MSESASMTGVVKELSLSLTDFKYDLERSLSSLLLSSRNRPAAPSDDDAKALGAGPHPLLADSDRKIALAKAADSSDATDGSLTKALFDKELLLHETTVLRNKVTSLTRQLNVAEETTARLRGECSAAARANESLQGERARMETKDALYHKKMTLLLNEFEFLKMSCATFDEVIESTQSQVAALRAQGEADKVQLAALQREARRAASRGVEEEEQARALKESNRSLRRQLAERQAEVDILSLQLAERSEPRSTDDGSTALAAEASINRTLRSQVASLEKRAIAGALSLEIVSAQLLQANKTAALVTEREAEAERLRQQVLSLGGALEQPQRAVAAPPAQPYEFSEELVGKALLCTACRKEFHFLCEFRNSHAVFATDPPPHFLCPACKPLPPVEPVPAGV